MLSHLIEISLKNRMLIVSLVFIMVKQLTL